MTEIEVYLDHPEGPVLVGTADVSCGRGETITRFSYDRSFLRGPGWEVSPDLPVIDAESVLAGLPGAFDDSSPDAWGRNLIVRRRAREWVGHAPPAVTDIDLLLGVSDRTRQGALRFSLGGGFLAGSGDVPRLVELERLLGAATSVAEGVADGDAATDELLDAGSGSLGGARPKASVVDGDVLMIAKFPHPDDRWDVMRWEAVALDLAEACGLSVPVRRLEVIGGRSVLLVHRFDRDAEMRIPYISARSMTGSGAGQGDYLEVAAGIVDHGGDVEADLHQLWRRMAFSIAFNNTDDHARNHGFLRQGAGWALSPVFDLNPDPRLGAHRSMAIGGQTSMAGCRRALVEVAESFWLGSAKAEQQWNEIVEVLTSWRSVAHAHDVVAEEIDRFAPSLDHWVDA